MKKFRFDYVFDGIALIFAGIQPEVLFQYIQLGLGILATLLSIAFSIWQWWKRASQDGKITEDEIKEGIDILKKGKDDLNDKGKKGE